MAAGHDDTKANAVDLVRLSTEFSLFREEQRACNVFLKDRAQHLDDCVDGLKQIVNSSLMIFRDPGKWARQNWFAVGVSFLIGSILMGGSTSAFAKVLKHLFGIGD